IVGLDGSLGLRRRCSPTSLGLQGLALSPARFVSPRCAVRANAEHVRLPRATSRSNRSRGVPATMPFGLFIAEPGRDTITVARDKTAVLAAAGTWVLTAAPVAIQPARKP